jgi:hypothetical protein
MKKLKVLILISAMILSVTGCNKKTEDSSQSSANETTVLETTEAVTQAATEPVQEGLILSNTYGYSLVLPEGIDTVNGEKIPESGLASEVDYVMVNSSTTKDNINVVAESGKDKKTFDSFTEDTFKQQCEALGVFTDFKINKYEVTKVDGFDAIHVETSAKNPDGETFSQTQIIVNRAEENAPYCYTFTYTDYTGKLKDEYQKSIESIKMTDAPKATEKDEYAGEPFTFDSCKGMEFNAPDGWTITEGESDTPHNVSADRAMFSPSEVGDVSNLLVTVSDGADENDSFLKYTQDDFIALLGDTYSDISPVSFETIKVGNYDAHKFVYDVSDDETEELNLRQTMLFINCPDTKKGIMVCLTDYNQKNSKISDTLETLIKFS